MGKFGVTADDDARLEALAQREWRKLATTIEDLNDRVSYEDDAFPIHPGSTIATDDEAAAPYRVSYVVQTGLITGIDHLHALKGLILDAGLLHMAAPFSLARGALENFATSAWVLTGQDHTERVTRALRWQAKNVKDSDRATRDKPIPGAKPIEERWLVCDEVAKRNSIAPSYRKGYTSTEAVGAAERAFQNLRFGVLFPWQLCSGFAHGRPWAIHGASERVIFDHEDPNTVNMRLNSTLSTVLYPTLASVDLARACLDLLAERSHA